MAEQCPTVGGLGEDGFNPDFDLKQLVLDPNSNMHIWGWLISGFLTLVTVTITAHTVKQHLGHYYTPDIQRYKVRVLAYPAIYAALAWFSYLRYKYETVIMFFAKLFESFAVYSLYMLLQSYLQPYRQKNEGQKIAVTTKVLGLVKITLKSKWGLHFRVITDICVLQFPIWNIIQSLVSIITQVKGVYCDGQFALNGAYTYLVIINFASLSLILAVLFTYLAVYNDEWKHGRIRAHGMFWCVKLPIMVIFYFGDLLLAALSHFDFIHDEAPKHSGGTFWPAAAIKNGYYVLLICAVMAIVALLMDRFFGLDPQEYILDDEEATSWRAYILAFVDGYLSFVPEFFKNVFLCGGDTVLLAKKRMHLRKKQQHARRLSDDEHHLLTPDAHDLETAQVLEDPYPELSEPPTALRQRRVSVDEGQEAARSLWHGQVSSSSASPAFNSSAVPLKPLGTFQDEQEPSSRDISTTSTTTRNDEPPPIPALALPPPPKQSRVLNHNDEPSEEAIAKSAHFQPHDRNDASGSSSDRPYGFF
ncbi:hypothetical protein RO3G_05574 [Lichtheimia corymbifera JMRC:FSU:9682]|uniref:Uncharacterized protein n=1 Tax=Lichtheimia corymbifera JMRC:FSU:9682 TaxID=1263082 RepID=A0A068RNW5_9FUNG|nr:hypothetical protein RO3G_05574 [Lichtheimia corymbifera JMRC:FSU:9682]